jgi:3-oxoacyl-[acyl-carrier protein] reductase
LSSGNAEPNEIFNERALEGRVVLVAGGTGGLGSATTALLARDGASVVAGYRSDSGRAATLKQAVEARFEGTTIHLVEGDITEPEARARYVETADSLGPVLYGLVCLTGDPARVKFDDVTDADLHDSLQKNYVAPLLLAREAATRMLRHGDGAIVLLSTMQAIGAFESSINYAGPKSALIQAARIMAKQWGGPGGIRVNVVAPGVNRAGMALQSIESGKYDFYVEQKVIPRFGKPEDVARVIRLLVEPDNYITGQVITVDGGLTLRRDRG